MRGDIFKRRPRGWPIPPAAPSTATLKADAWGARYFADFSFGTGFFMAVACRGEEKKVEVESIVREDGLRRLKDEQVVAKGMEEGLVLVVKRDWAPTEPTDIVIIAADAISVKCLMN